MQSSECNGITASLPFIRRMPMCIGTVCAVPEGASQGRKEKGIESEKENGRGRHAHEHDSKERVIKLIVCIATTSIARAHTHARSHARTRRYLYMGTHNRRGLWSVRRGRIRRGRIGQGRMGRGRASGVHLLKDIQMDIQIAVELVRGQALGFRAHGLGFRIRV
jgi:hypothetical protein